MRTREQLEAEWARERLTEVERHGDVKRNAQRQSLICEMEGDSSITLESFESCFRLAEN